MNDPFYTILALLFIATTTILFFYFHSYLFIKVRNKKMQAFALKFGLTYSNEDIKNFVLRDKIKLFIQKKPLAIDKQILNTIKGKIGSHNIEISDIKSFEKVYSLAFYEWFIKYSTVIKVDDKETPVKNSTYDIFPWLFPSTKKLQSIIENLK